MELKGMDGARKEILDILAIKANAHFCTGTQGWCGQIDEFFCMYCMGKKELI
jgi:hypothetical protein